MKKLLASKKGFTLVELIVVIVIIVILAAALVTSLVGYIQKAQETNSLLEAQSVYTAAQALISEDVGLHGLTGDDTVYTYTASSSKYTVTDKENGTAIASGINTYLGNTVVATGAGAITTITVNEFGTIIEFNYTSSNGKTVTYYKTATGAAAAGWNVN